MILDLVGRRFGRLTVVSRAKTTTNKNTVWLCVCRCGQKRKVGRPNLVQRHTRSCGCLQSEEAAARGRISLTTHGLSDSRLYRIWRGMLSRCYRPKNDNYNSYGGRGIRVCRLWHKFEAFAEWAKTGHRSNLQLDRKNNNANYTPGNCRWVTPKTNSNNRRRPDPGSYPRVAA